MNSFKCSKCSYNTIRNYDLTRHLKRVHGIYVNTPFKGDNQLQAGISSHMSEERQYERESHRQQSRMPEEEEENEPSFNPEYTRKETLREALKRTKCEILDCILNILPPSLRAEAKRICDLTKENPQIFINDKHEVIIRGQVEHGSNILTLIIEELMKCQSLVNTKQYETENKLLKYLLAHQTKALERERGVAVCEKFESMFGGTVQHFEDSNDESEDEDDDEEDDIEDEDDDEEEDIQDEDENGMDENGADETEEDEEDEDVEEEYSEEPSMKKRK